MALYYLRNVKYNGYFWFQMRICFSRRIWYSFSFPSMLSASSTAITGNQTDVVLKWKAHDWHIPSLAESKQPHRVHVYGMSWYVTRFSLSVAVPYLSIWTDTRIIHGYIVMFTNWWSDSKPKVIFVPDQTVIWFSLHGLSYIKLIF